MNITFIDHSGFLVELDSVNLLFDYYKGQIPPMDTEKPLVVFVSHWHPDHFNPEIFELAKTYQKVFFVLDKKCAVKWKAKAWEEQGISEERLLLVKKNSEYHVNGIDIKTFHSTDEGVAYLLQVDGKRIYHAGDLNDWRFPNESKMYNNNMRKNFERELEALRGELVDVAFLPLDPRQREYAMCGMELYLETIDVTKVFPMHFWGKYSLLKKFVQKYPQYTSQIVCIEKKGQQFCL